MGKKNLWNLDRLEKLAKELDLKDKLKKFKNEFIYPDDKLYFDGNSLGLLSKKTKEMVICMTTIGTATINRPL